MSLPPNTKLYLVNVISASGLVSQDSNGKGDPYVVITTPFQKLKTRVINDNNDPEWNEAFEIFISSSIRFEIFDKNSLVEKDKIQGAVTVNLEELAEVGSVEVQKNLSFEAGAAGILTIGFSLLPPVAPADVKKKLSNKNKVQATVNKTHRSAVVKAGEGSDLTRIRLRVISGENLIACDNGKTSDPFCRIKTPDSKSYHQTQVIKKTLNPTWNESFLVEFSKQFEIEVFDDDVLGNDFMGTRVIKKEDIVDCLNNPSTEIIKDYPLANVDSGSLKLGITLVSSTVGQNSGIFLSALGGKNKFFIEKEPFAILMGIVLFSFLLGYFRFYITMIAFFIGYIAFWKQSVNVAAREEVMKREAQLWDDHYKTYPNIETVEWINKTLLQVYKRHGASIGEFIAAQVNPQIQPFTPPFLKSVGIDKIDLGMVAPKLNNFKVLTKDPNSLELECYCNYPSDLQITLAIKGGFGMMSVPIVVENIAVYAQAWIKVNYQDELPLVKTVEISLLEKPTIDFSLRPLNGMNITAFPGLSGWINDLINVVVIDGMLLAPNKFVLDVAALVAPPSSSTPSAAAATTPAANPLASSITPGSN